MAMTSDSPLIEVQGKFNTLPLAAVLVYAGAALTLNASGYATNGTAGQRFVGHSYSRVDNSAGSAGDLTVDVYTGTYRGVVTLTGVAITDVGKDVYLSDENTYTLTPTLTRVGKVVRYDSANTAEVEFETHDPDAEGDDLSPIVYEFDTETGVDATAHTLIPASQNPRGLLILGVFGRVTEVFAGASEDQGIVTVQDEDDTAIATLTPTNAGADAVGDIIVGYAAHAATTGAATKTVAAGKAVEGIVSQATSGAGAAGKMKVYIEAIPLA